MSVGELTSKISILSHDIQEIENEIIRLQLKHDDLVKQREKLRTERNKLDSDSSIRNQEITLKMSMDMLGREVGIDKLYG